MTYPVPLRPLSELGVIIAALRESGCSPHLEPYLLQRQNLVEGPVIHEDIERDFILDSMKLLFHVEEPVYADLEEEDIWEIHGALDDYRHVLDYEIVDLVFDKFTDLVGQLENPPYY